MLSPLPISTRDLVRLGGRMRPYTAGDRERHAIHLALSIEVAALHLAIQAEPLSLDRKVFELHYLWRVRHIKTAAATLGFGRQHWYRLLSAFRARACRRARGIQGTRSP